MLVPDLEDGLDLACGSGRRTGIQERKSVKRSLDAELEMVR